MAPGKVNRAKPPAARAAPTTNDKKKGKGKGVERSAPVPGQYDYEEFEEEDDDDETALPPVEYLPPHTHTHSHPHLHAHRTINRTGLSPELASVHVSTTASLSASLAAHLKPTTAAEAELLATADHLARSMEGPEGGLVNDEYWASFPDHLRNFVRHTYSQLSSVRNGDPDSSFPPPIKTQAMYSLATKNGGAGRYPPGAFPPIPFDPAIFADPQFALAMEQAAVNGTLQTEGGTLSPANVVLYPGEQDYGEECYSEDEVDGLNDEVDELDDEFVGERRAQAAHFTLSFEDPLAHAAAAGVAAGTAPNGTRGPKKKRNRNRKKKERALGESPAGARPEEGEGGTVTNGGRPGSTTNRMPAARPPPAAATNPPPPSSRAAGKKPMAYNATPAQDPPPASRRAASKAPVSSHQYGHNHTHHHPSPPSSNASAPHKPRPPAAGQQPQKNSKIWSTSTTEERERIKEFWLGLGEEERRNLVKIEKEAVLKKMKEQQKHSCSCAVCGRKRYVVHCAPATENFSSHSPSLLSSAPPTGCWSPFSLSPGSVPPQRRNAIEEELEVLYDAYYEELEQYANYQQRYISSGGTLPPPQGPGPFPGSVELDKNGAVISPQPPAAHRGKAVVANGRKPVKQTESEFDDDGEEDYPAEDDGYEDDEEEEEEEDEEEDEEDDGDPEDEDDVKQDRRTAAPRRRAANGTKVNGRDGLGNFGSNLTVTGKCLLVSASLRICILTARK